MERTITMRGRAIVTAPSDITVVRLNVSGKEKDFAKAVKAMSASTTKLKDAIEAAGIPRESLKTSALSVHQVFRKEKIGEDRYGHAEYKEYPDGFSYDQNVSYEFGTDNEKLSRSIGNILNTKVTPRIEFSYRNSDMEGMKNRALSEACRHALEEATTIVESVGARVGKLISVERSFSTSYDDDDDRIGCSIASCSALEPMMLDIDPEDTSVEQSVTMVWEIEG